MKDSTVFTLAGVTGFAGSEALAVHLMIADPSFTPHLSDWVIALAIGGPVLFFLLTIPLAVVCALIAMARYPR